MKNFFANIFRDWAEAKTDEQLSAYLDGALRPHEQARLEAELARDPHLRARLEALRRTVELVRAMPPVRAPRNFLLTPAMAAEVRPTPARALARRASPVALTFATALSGLVCIFLLVANLLSAGQVGPRAVAPAPMAAHEGPAPTMPVTVPESAGVEAPSPAARALSPEPTEVPEPLAAPHPEDWAELPHPLEGGPAGGGGAGGGGEIFAPPSPPGDGIGGGEISASSEEPTPLAALRALPQAETQAPESVPAPTMEPSPTPAWKEKPIEPAMPVSPSWLPVGGMALLTLILAVLTVCAWRAR